MKQNLVINKGSTDPDRSVPKEKRNLGPAWTRTEKIFEISDQIGPGRNKFKNRKNGIG